MESLIYLQISIKLALGLEYIEVIDHYGGHFAVHFFYRASSSVNLDS